MGSSGGSSDYAPPSIPTPPNVAPYGSSVPFKPNFISFLGDTNVPSTGLTPDMLAAIDQMYQDRPSIGVQPPPPMAAAAPPPPKEDRNKLAEAMRGGNGSAGGRGGSAGGGGWGGR